MCRAKVPNTQEKEPAHLDDRSTLNIRSHGAKGVYSNVFAVIIYRGKRTRVERACHRLAPGIEVCPDIHRKKDIFTRESSVLLEPPFQQDVIREFYTFNTQMHAPMHTFYITYLYLGLSQGGP